MPSVILFRPIYEPNYRSTPTYPWAFMCLASVLFQRGVDVTLIDETCEADAYARLDEALEKKRPVAVGITSMTGDQIRYGLACARHVRERSRAAIVWGGIHPSLLPEQTARHALVDYVVGGEGEYAFAELIACLERGDDPAQIPGVYFERDGAVRGTRREGFVDLASLPPMPYHLADVDRYIVARPDLGAERYFEVCTSRGCPHHCGFCYIECVHSSQWRSISPEAAVARIEDVVAKFGVDAVLFREDNFFVNRKRVEAIARLLIERNVRIKWAASCRINYFANYKPEFVELLRQSGCALLTFGVESGSDRVLEFIHKDITVEMVERVARMLAGSGIRGTYHFMGGFPSETASEFLDTCRLIDRLMAIAPEIVVREMSIFAPYPGVGLVPECVQRGYREPESLEAWVDMDWSNPARPWLSDAQSRLISDTQFLIARLQHSNPLFRTWIRRRWRQLLASEKGIDLPERRLIDRWRGR